MSFRHFSAVKTLKGKSGLCFRKCLFSVTRASAPTYSTYAAMSASASLKPFASYLAPNSKGTRKSSSITVKALMKIMNSRKYSGDIFRFTSSNIVRGIRMVCKWPVSSSFSSNLNDASALDGPKANMYSFESMTSRKFFFPNFFPRFAKLFDNLFLAHLENGGRISRDHLSELFKMFFGLPGIRFISSHFLLPLNKEYYAAREMSR